MTSHLQRIQNNAARVILCLPMSSSITIHLKSLHWLPVKARGTYKIACLCYHWRSSTAPSYVADVLHIEPSLSPTHTPCLFTIDLQTVRQRLVIVHFLLLGGGGVDPIPCVSTHRISDPRSGPAKLLPPHVKQRSYPHGVRPQIPDR